MKEKNIEWEIPKINGHIFFTGREYKGIHKNALNLSNCNIPIMSKFDTKMMLKRELKLITNPSRYTSRASEVLKKNILPQFARLESPLRKI